MDVNRSSQACAHMATIHTAMPELQEAMQESQELRMLVTSTGRSTRRR